MTLVVALGLRNYYDYGADAEGACQGLRSLVQGGYTTLVREVFPASRESAGLEGARIREVAGSRGRARERWLAAEEARDMLDMIAAVYAKHDCLASFAWVQLERMMVFNLQPLALVLDGSREPHAKGIRLPGLDQRLGVLDLDASARSWSGRSPQSRIAAALHRIAKQLRLVVRSG